MTEDLPERGPQPRGLRRRWLVLVVALVVLILIATALGVGRAASPAAGGPSPDAPSAATPAVPSVASSELVPSPIAAGSSPLPTEAASPPPVPSPASPPPGGTLEPLAALLAMLPIEVERRSGYDRSLFVHWIDADGDGCDTRHEVLIRDARTKPHVGTRCSLTGGSWLSLYDGLTFTDPADLQIDHVIPLAEAWDSGAFGWSAQEREAFANDLGVPFALLAVSASTNESKSDDDPADWLPPATAATCPYLGDWLATKVRWALAIDQREHDALASDVRSCPGAEMPLVPAEWPAGGLPTPAPVATPPPTGGTGGSGGSGGSRAGCDPAYPTVCIPTPPPDLDCGDIPYRNFQVLPPDPDRFDGDHDGVGCET